MIIDESNAHEYVDDYEMNISNKDITELIYVPSYVTHLFCGYNELRTLPDLPNIVELFCGYNKITKLPELPNVKSLWCYNNELTKLPELPNVTVLDCRNNKLTRLPDSPNVVNQLWCENNKFDVEYLEYLQLKYPQLIVM